MATDIQSSLLAYNQIHYPNLPANLNPFTAGGTAELADLLGPPLTRRYHGALSGFNTLWGTGATVAQSLPLPEVFTGDTINGGGDRIGHSTYNSMELKFSHRYSAGLTVQASYVFSKSLTDADN